MLNDINLVPTTKKIVALTKKNGSKNMNEMFFNAIQDNNVEVLAEIIHAFAEDIDGKPKFKDIDEVYDFIDLVKKDGNNDYESIFKKVAEVINEMGFFVKKMTPEELTKVIETPYMNFDMTEIITQSTRDAMRDVVQEEFRGFKA